MLEVTIIDKKQETPDILSFELAQKDGADLPPFEAGSHIDVHVSSQIVRQYSLYNSPANHKTYKIAVLKDPNSRGGSVEVHNSFNVGDTIKISPPRNLFALKAQSQRSLLFAGGIGITPLMSMAEVLNDLGHDFELHYHTRSQTNAAFYGAFKTSVFADKIFFHFDDSKEDNSIPVNKALSQPSANTHLYTCGPNGFMDYIFTSARSLGWSDQNLHKEVFSAEPVELDDSDKSFTLKLVRSDLTLEVPADKTALEVLEEAGIEVDVSCQQGICGACLTNVSDGTPDHRDMFLSDDEKALNNQFTPCCSRALSDSLSIDL